MDPVLNPAPPEDQGGGGGDDHNYAAQPVDAIMEIAAQQVIQDSEADQEGQIHGQGSTLTQSMQAMSVDHAVEVLSTEVATIEETANKEDDAEAQARVEAAKQNELKRLEELSIKGARKNAMGETILSAEPFNFFQDMNKKPFGYMTMVVGVLFKTGWTPSSYMIKNLIEHELGFKGDEAHDKIKAVGRNGKYITLTAKDKETKREIYRILTQPKFKNKYKCASFEEPETVVMINYVPQDLPDDELVQMLKSFGTVVEDPVRMVDDLGFHNLQRKVVMKLKYDIPSYLKIEGYMTQPRYDGQPSTCRLCGKRDHMANQCDLYRPKPGNKYNNANKKENKPKHNTFTGGLKEVEQISEAESRPGSGDDGMDFDVEEMKRAVDHSVQLLKEKKGPGMNALDNPAFDKMMRSHYKQLELSNMRHRENQKRPKDDGNEGFIVAGPSRKKTKNRRFHGRPLGNASYNLPMNSGNKFSSNQHDYWNGDIRTENRYEFLRYEHSGGEYSDPPNTDDENYRNYVSQKNSVFM